MLVLALEDFGVPDLGSYMYIYTQVWHSHLADILLSDPGIPGVRSMGPDGRFLSVRQRSVWTVPRMQNVALVP